MPINNMNNVTKQRKEAMRIFTEIRNKNKNVKQSEITRDIQEAIKNMRRHE